VRASNIFRVLSIDNVRGSEDVVGPRRGGGGASVVRVNGSRGGYSGSGLHVNEVIGNVVDAVVRDGGHFRLERVHDFFAWERRRRSKGVHLAF
jgi:hypothetical protein